MTLVPRWSEDDRPYAEAQVYPPTHDLVWLHLSCREELARSGKVRNVQPVKDFGSLSVPDMKYAKEARYVLD